MYKYAIIFVLCAYVCLLILQLTANIRVSFSDEEKAAIKAAVKSAVCKFFGRFRHGKTNDQ